MGPKVVEMLIKGVRELQPSAFDVVEGVMLWYVSMVGRIK